MLYYHCLCTHYKNVQDVQDLDHMTVYICPAINIGYMKPVLPLHLLLLPSTDHLQVEDYVKRLKLIKYFIY